MKHLQDHWYGLLTLLLVLGLTGCGATKTVGTTTAKQYDTYSIAFYNMENLFDTQDDPDNSGDDDFLPTGPYAWTQKQYEQKLDNLARVISLLGRENTPYGPAFIGTSEIENRRVLEDLVTRDAIKGMGLKVIHEDGPDRRGIDVAALYNPNIFELERYEYIPFKWDENPDFVTRDQLHAYGKIAGEQIHFIVLHWPSRYGGSKSSPLREAAARTTLSIVQKIQASDPDANIVIMGDLNDDPTNVSVSEVLNAKKKRSEVPNQGLYNPSASLFEKGVGTLVYQNKWNFFDQMMVSRHLISKESGLRLWKMEVFDRDFLITQEGKRKGYPHRTFENNSFINGYSDHFPVLIYLLKER
ncbi:MAG: endonuclease/exonuclease/phosphatase family protein [Porphyromonas sp.]|nr:endonuclease/exonuclease/phosphatase family protein [Porphyromonas sp.]